MSIAPRHFASRIAPVNLAARIAAGQGSELESFRPERPTVSSERILRIQGYTDLTRVRPAIRQASEAMARVAAESSEPCVAFRRVRIEAISGATLVLEDGVALHCPVFPRALRGCDEVVPFVLTLGRGVSRRVVELADAGDLLEAVLLEAAGWLCIEDATRQFKIHLREQCLRSGRRITSRLGPGYSYKVEGQMCTWRLEEQPALFAMLGETGALPVSLMASCAMQPKLSRSGMYGAAPLDPAVTADGVRIPLQEPAE